MILSAFALPQAMCACHFSIPEPRIEAIEVREFGPLMGKTYYRIFYFGDLVMYEKQYRFDSTVKQLRIDSATRQMYSDDTLVSAQWRSYFFVFHKDSAFGYRYDPQGFYKSTRRQTHPEIKLIAGTNTFESSLRMKPDSVIWGGNHTELKEVFAFSKTQAKPSGRVCLYFSKQLNHLKYSLNKALDSSKRMKFFKVEFFGDEFYSEKDKMLWPPSYSMTEIREMPVHDSKMIIAYFNQYKESIATQD